VIAPPAGGSLLLFAEAAEAVGAVNSKLAKVRILGLYLASLSAENLPLAARYFAGRVFASWDQRVLSIGGSALKGAMLEVGGLDEARLTAIWARHRDAGDCVFEVVTGAPGQPLMGLDLGALHAAFARMADAEGPRGRRLALTALLGGCTALEAKYVVKLITGEMRIGLRAGLVEAAIAAAFARNARAVTRADMLVGDLGEVALLAKHDRLAEAAPRLFSPLRYMLASPLADVDEAVRRLGDVVWVEDKYDGIRCQLHRGRERIALYSRDLREVTAQFPEVVAAAEALPPGVILDGEILAFRGGRVLPFAALQRRLGRLAPSPAILADVPVIHVAWDLLVSDGASRLDEPLRERRRLLEELGLGGSLAAAHRETARGPVELDGLFHAARARLNEGLIVKDPDSSYMPGRRGLAWLKIKRPLDTLDVVVVGAEWGHGRRRDVLSDLTFAVRDDGGDALLPVGKAYTGLTDQEIREMTALLLELTTVERGEYREVRPDIIIEVAFDAVQESTRHGSGFALRFPRIVRWRRDKGLADIDVLSRVRALSSARSGPQGQMIDRAGD